MMDIQLFPARADTGKSATHFWPLRSGTTLLCWKEWLSVATSISLLSHCPGTQPAGSQLPAQAQEAWVP